MNMALNVFRSRLEQVVCDAISGSAQLKWGRSDFMQVVEISHLIASSIGNISDDGIRRILAVVEDAAVNGDEAAKSAATTGFLENLQNRAANGAFPFERIVPMLGRASLEFCRAWDGFTGVSTPGSRGSKEQR